MKQTPSQTVGPFYAIGLTRTQSNVLATVGTAGKHLRIEGQVWDADGQPVPDALIEIWQANVYGRYNHPDDKQEKPLDPNFTGWGRCGTDQNGAFWFETIKPGPLPGVNQILQAPHINVVVFARGMLTHAFTRVYFGDQQENDSDPVLSSIKNKARRQTLIAAPEERDGKRLYRFDIRLQGDNETVFFDM
jgi:protocatechuate 3,4-dioxygenase alpha subunit